MASMRTATIKFLTLQETTRLFHRLASYRREKAIFLLSYRHGLRASEVGMLRIEDIDFRTLRIMIHRLKGSHSGEHPLQPDEAKAIKAYLRERRRDSPILFTSNRGIRHNTYLFGQYGQFQMAAGDTSVGSTPSSSAHGARLPGSKLFCRKRARAFPLAFRVLAAIQSGFRFLLFLASKKP